MFMAAAGLLVSQQGVGGVSLTPQAVEAEETAELMAAQTGAQAQA